MDPALFGLTALLSTLAVGGRALFAGKRQYALFSGLILVLTGGSVAAVFGKLGFLQPVALLLQVLAALHYGGLVAPRGMRPSWYRVGVSVPALVYVAGALVALPWAFALALGFDPPLVFLPWLIALLGLPSSIHPKAQDVDLVLDYRPVRGLRRVGGGIQRTGMPLRIVQISDPHLGPFMPVERLRAICERTAEADPDLVLLTGDYLTMESNTTAEALTLALEPLRPIASRCYAIRGNHDLEAPAQVAQALEANGIRLLIDAAALAETRLGRVQVIGLDWHWRDRAPKMRAVLDRYPRVTGVPRLVLLHDPGAFRLIEDGQADLVFSGHTHGGQIGLFGLGLQRSVLALADTPDHGFWGQGRNRLYVHRGTGHYGYPIRLGVPGEEGVLRLHLLPR